MYVKYLCHGGRQTLFLLGKRRQWQYTIRKWPYYIHQRLILGCASIRMKLLRKETVEAELDVIATVAAYNEILLAEKVSDTEPGHVLYQSLVHHPKGIEGKAPHEFKYMSKCTNMPFPCLL